MLGRKKEEAWRTRDVVVKFEHLNARLQHAIGYSGIKEFWEEFREFSRKGPPRTLRAARVARGLFEALIPLGLFPSNIPLQIASGLSVGGRMGMASHIQEVHDKLVHQMRRQGVLQTRFEGHYPNDWVNPSIIEKTHPIFHVKQNGDLVFHRPTRMEYARMKFQEKFAVRFFGANPWRWRAYLKKPEAPEKIREWAKRKVREWAKKLKPAPVPALRPVPVHGRGMFRPALRRRFAR